MIDFNTEYFDCKCSSPEHTLRFVYDEDDIYIEIYLRQYRNFFKRIWIAIKYIFGYKCQYGDWDCFILKEDDIQRMIRLLTKKEKKYNIFDSEKINNCQRNKGDINE